MWQEVIIGLLFAVALFYLTRMVYRAFFKKGTCEAGCSCSTVSVKELEEKMKKDPRFEKTSQTNT